MHPSDLILLPPFAGGLLVWPAFRILSRNRGTLFRELAEVFAWTVGGLLLLAIAQFVIAFFVSFSLMTFFAVANLFSLLGSMAAFFRASTGRARLLLRRYFIAAAGIPAFALIVMLPMGGCKDLDIGLHEARTRATVLPPTWATSPQNSRYSYNVDGHTYTSSRGPAHAQPGAKLEIRYCTLHPSFSTSRDSFEFIVIIGISSGFAAVLSLIISLSKRWNRAASD